MAKKKSKAQINRMKRRAAARGEEYVPPPAAEQEGQKSAGNVDGRKLSAARKLRKELDAIQTNEGLKAKERRSAKRKAEAIAAEEAGCTAEGLLQWYNDHGHEQDITAEGNEAKVGGESQSKSKRNPYIVFVGQLSYETTGDGLFNHIKNELGNDHEVTKDTVQIRLLTDAKTQKSRGMAFVETTDPELLYACIRLHHTLLDGRRINVERSAGGKAGSDARKSKLSQLRKEQEEHMSETVDKMLSDHLSSGELQEKELDDGVIALCKRHSAAVVEAALLEYVESGGRDKDNPSAYLTYLIGKVAEDGPQNSRDDGKKERKGGRGGGERAKKRSRPSSAVHETELGVVGHKLQSASTFLQAGVDMKTSEVTKPRDMANIFPSMARGRGRGRGYM